MEEVRPEGAVAALGAAVAPPEVEYANKKWKVGHPTQEAKAELEKLVLAAAEENLAAARPVVSAARFAALEKRLDDHVLARRWQTWGELWAETVNGPDAFPLFLLSLMKPHHPEATAADARGMWLHANRATRNALVVVLPGFFDFLAAALPADEESRRRGAEEWKAEILGRLRQGTLTA